MFFKEFLESFCFTLRRTWNNLWHLTYWAVLFFVMSKCVGGDLKKKKRKFSLELEKVYYFNKIFKWKNGQNIFIDYEK
jgi:hypothetical protein